MIKKIKQNCEKIPQMDKSIGKDKCINDIKRENFNGILQ